MKKTVLLFIFFLTLMYSNESFSQIDIDLVDIKTRKTIPFSDINNTYKLKKEIPTLIITWSGKWCSPCLKLIDRYNNCDLSLLNIITVNIDAESSVEEVLKEGYHLKWNKTLNFLANIGKDKKGFDNIFNISSAPLLLYSDNGKISDAIIDYSLFPYKLIESGVMTDVKFIWNSSEDLNSLAWSYYENQNDTAKLETAKKWTLRSIELDKNYHNTDTYAALLFKTGEYTKALKTAKEAIEIAKAKSIDYNSTTNLINKIIEKL
nr:hypothetical protein [uncultured Flavobacterium sp.]